jgi:hypothetical protein
MSAGRLVQAVAMQDVGRVRVSWSAERQEFTVRGHTACGRMVAEYFTNDKTDALGTADHILGELAALAARQALAGRPELAA